MINLFAVLKGWGTGMKTIPYYSQRSFFFFFLDNTALRKQKYLVTRAQTENKSSKKVKPSPFADNVSKGNIYICIYIYII